MQKANLKRTQHLSWAIPPNTSARDLQEMNNQILTATIIILTTVIKIEHKIFGTLIRSID